jgi:16S rRNA (guanine527-N7)-methyltransferase
VTGELVRDSLAPAGDPGIEALVAGAAQLGLDLGARQQSAFACYRAELLAWNARVNLTAITEPAAVATRHFLDSLTILLAVPPAERDRPLRLVDVGSGAGLPGLALALACPAWRVTVIDSVAKKTAFLRHACAMLGLEERTEVLTARAEEVARDPAHRGCYDLAVARAVASLATLAEYLLPLCRQGGRMIALKKGDLSAEVAAAARAVRLLGGGPLATVPVPELADLGAGRVVLAARKERATAPQYPRRPGLPAKDPL